MLVQPQIKKNLNELSLALSVREKQYSGGILIQSIEGIKWQAKIVFRETKQI